MHMQNGIGPVHQGATRAAKMQQKGPAEDSKVEVGSPGTVALTGSVCKASDPKCIWVGCPRYASSVVAG